MITLEWTGPSVPAIEKLGSAIGGALARAAFALNNILVAKPTLASRNASMV